MALFNIFKIFKKKEKPAENKKVAKKIMKKKETQAPTVKKTRKKTRTIAPSEKQEFSEIAVKILIAPQITEKATELGDQGKYIFRVKKEARKPQIKKAIQEMYGVNIISINIINVPKKKRRSGRTEGYRAGFKKAIVTLAKGQKIEVMPG